MIFNYTKTQNDIQNALNSSVNIVATAIQSCPSLSALQSIDLVGCSNVNLSNISFQQTVDLQSSCIQDSTFMQDATQQIQEQLSQLATSVSEGLAVADATIAQNTVQNINNLKTELVNGFTQNCGDHTYAQSFTCTNSQNVTVSGVSYNQAIKDIVSCTMTSESVQKAVTDVTLAIDQKAEAEQKGLFGGLAGVIAAIVIIALIVVLPKGGGGAGKPGQTLVWKIALVTSIAVLAVSALFITLYACQFWPYKKIYPSSSQDDKDYNTKLFTPFAIAGGVSLAALIGLIVYANSKGKKAAAEIQSARVDAAAIGRG